MKRITICLRKQVLTDLDGIIEERCYKSRSQAISDFIKRAALRKKWRENKKCAGIVSIVYTAGKKNIISEIENMFLKYYKNIANISENFLEKKHFVFILLKGYPAEIEKISDSFKGIKGIDGGSFSILSGF